MEDLSSEYARSLAYNFGLPIDTQELPRESFLSRLHASEKTVLKSILGKFAKRDFSDKYLFGCLLAVGSSTYSDAYYVDLEKTLLDHGLTREDSIREEAYVSVGDAYLSLIYESNSYDHFTYLASTLSDPAAFHSVACSKEEYAKIKSLGQLEYTRKVSIDQLLTNKGEDIDVLFALDTYETLSREAFTELVEFMSDYLDVSVEETQLSGHSYFPNADGSISRVKSIEGVATTFSFATARRRIHMYVHSLPLQFHIDKNAVENIPFSRLVRKGLYHELIRVL